MFLWSLVFLLSINGYRAQQSYVDNKQLDCQYNDTTTLGYTCNPLTSISTCFSYVTFRSQPPLYNTPSSIASLLRSNPNDITALNNLSSPSANIPADALLLVPIRNCSCSDGGFYQHNATYVIHNADDNYFTIANNTYEGLTTCQAMASQNKYDYGELDLGNNLTVPLRCACPSANQTAAGINYLLTYLITWGDDASTMADSFGVVEQGILDANEISPTHVIFPFTPILIPLTNEPTINNTLVTTAPPPSPSIILVSPTNGGSSSDKWVFIGVGIGVGFILLVALSGFFIWLFRRSKIQRRHNFLPSPKRSPNTMMVPSENNSWSIAAQGLQSSIESLTVYKYEKLQKATRDFSKENKVKGSVYRGYFRGDFAAVKILKGDVSKEINILKHINHSNIITLSGFCLHQGNTYLVYEFAEHGSLCDWLHSNTKKAKHDPILEWKQRVQIAYDVADALNYLHNFITPPCIHKNLKSSNVLLDGNMRAKITNFGLARSMNENEDNEVELTRHVVGTYGYMPPEYIEDGLITPKTDVFALGVLISELLSGKEAILEQVQLSKMIKDVVGGENVREKLLWFMDGRLRGEYPLELAYSMAKLGSECVAADLNERPSITEAFVSLSKIMSSLSDWDPYVEQHSRSLSHGRSNQL